MGLKPTLNTLLKLKLCGKTLEGEEKFANVTSTEIDEEKAWSEYPAPKMDALMALILPLSTSSALTEGLQKDLKVLFDTRANENWASAEADNAKAEEESAKLLSAPAPRKSAAIRIEPDPNDVKTHVVQPKPSEPVTSGGGNGGELTEEELRFMSDAMGEDGGSEVDNEDLEESDSGMTEDIADAYEQFLAEQSKNGCT